MSVVTTTPVRSRSVEEQSRIHDSQPNENILSIRVVPGCGASSRITVHADVSIVPTSPGRSCGHKVSLTCWAHVRLKQVSRGTSAVILADVIWRDVFAAFEVDPVGANAAFDEPRHGACQRGLANARLARPQYFGPPQPAIFKNILILKISNTL